MGFDVNKKYNYGRRIDFTMFKEGIFGSLFIEIDLSDTNNIVMGVLVNDWWLM